MSSPQEQFAAAVRSTQAQAVDAVETWTKITQDAFGKIGAEVPTTAPEPRSGDRSGLRFRREDARGAARFRQEDAGDEREGRRSRPG